MRIIRRVLSPIGVLLAFLGGGWLLRWLTAGSLTALQVGNPTLDDLLVFVVAVLAWACFAWLALGTLLTALSAVPGAVGAVCGSLAERLTPAVYRRAARFALGLSVAAGPVLGTLPANAATVDQPAQAAATAQLLPSLDRPTGVTTQLPAGIQLPDLDRPTGAHVLDQLPMPDRPSVGEAGPGHADLPNAELPNPDRPMSRDQTAPGQTTRDPVTRAPVRGVDDVAQVVVKRGDSLWSIAKGHLPPGANDAEVNREWKRWYDANRHVIGDNPDLILPGQILTPPPPT